MGLSPNQSLVALASVLIVLTTVSMVLRFVARPKLPQKYLYEEWFAVIAFVLFLAYTGIAIWAGQLRESYKPGKMPYSATMAYLKCFFAGTLCYQASITAAKFSILALYQRLFGVDQTFNRNVKLFGWLNLLWFIGATIGFPLRCNPAEKVWNPIVPGKCLDLSIYTAVVEVPNSLLDFGIMALPVAMLKKLRLPRRHKIVLSFLFLLGGFVGVIGFIRMVALYKPSQFSIITMAQWVEAQLGLAIICCCLPIYRPLLRRIEIPVKLRKYYHSLRGPSSKSVNTHAKTSDADVGESEYTLGGLGQERRVLTEVEGNTSRGNQNEGGKGYQLKTVSVERVVEMV